jgi:hypothetical protein
MAFRWACEQCGELHGRNPSACRKCGSHVFEPVSEATVSEHAVERGDHYALDSDSLTTVGTTPDDENYASSPDVAPDGSLKTTETAASDRSAGTSNYVAHLRERIRAFTIRQRSNALTLFQLAGFAAFFFGVFRLFGIGVYNMDGLGPISREIFTTVYIPGPWSAWSVTWELAWVWMGIGIAIVGMTTRSRR